MRVPPGNSTLCAFGVPGVRAAVTDTPGGVEVRFSSRDEADELRKRVHDAIEERTGPGTSWQLNPEQRRLRAKTNASLIDSPDGITLVATPIHPDDLAEIRSYVHRRVAQARAVQCD